MLKDNLAVSKTDAVCGRNDKRRKSEKEHPKAHGIRHYRGNNRKLRGLQSGNVKGIQLFV